MSERRQNFHQSIVGTSLAPSSPLLQSRIRQTAAYLQSHGFAHADALNAAYAHYYNQLLAQTRLLAFMDCFYVLGLVTLIAAPLALLTKKFKTGAKATAAH
jgi:DHA2 family multidrug resistance protein